MPANNAWSQGRVGPGAQFLDPKTLQRIGSLELVARGVVEGFLQGLHRSPFLGQSMDFAEYRPYVVGDDPRRIDWKVFARTERYYVKEYEAETNTNFTVLLDCSHSMAFGEAEFTKFDYARYLAACLTFLARKQGDRVGIVTFDSKVREIVPLLGPPPRARPHHDQPGRRRTPGRLRIRPARRDEPEDAQGARGARLGPLPRAGAVPRDR